MRTMMKPVGVISAFLAVVCVSVLGIGASCSKIPSSPPLTPAQLEVAQKLKQTVRGDLIFNAADGEGIVWRVVNRRENFIIIEHIMNGDTAFRVLSIEEIARWTDVVTNGLSEDPRYCQLAERYLTSVR